MSGSVLLPPSVRPEDALVVAAALGLAVIHVVASRLWLTGVVPRRRLLSVAGGVSVAYVFVHLLPEIGAGSDVLRESPPAFTPVASRAVYVVALAGFVAFYGVERFAKCRWAPDPTETTAKTFWAHVASFGAYNVLTGYLLVHRETGGAESLLWFAVAMALHFLVIDAGLRRHHRAVYHRFGRWVLAAAVLVGTAVGYVVGTGEATLALLLAFLGGGIVLNAIKEELPEERDSRFWSFALGAGVYATLLLAA